MKLDELAEMIAAGDATTTMIEAMGQRMAREPEGWDWEHEAAVCECGLLLVALPHTIRQTRVVVVPDPAFRPPHPGAPRPTRALNVFYDMSHAHAADSEGRARCAECWEEDAPCGGHEAEMCDTPNAETCPICADEPVLPGGEHCLECRPAEAEWDKDAYLGL
ncbi:hypothetical protein AB0M39_40935 [Streptomyces sp. NPDC051907]|uniref:hypothetical protein n=1 Tax=Streptomyces sp. NPDC051907 TaxID=3155284 RepID=UPI0034327C54